VERLELAGEEGFSSLRALPAAAPPRFGWRHGWPAALADGAERFSDVFRGTLLAASGAAGGGGGDCDDLCDLDAVGIYFSAQWCPPCRAFTPRLADFYAATKAAGARWAVVLASNDRSPLAFAEYLGGMPPPWRALPFGDARVAGLKALFERQCAERGLPWSSAIPTLVLVEPRTGALLTAEGRAKVEAVLADPAAMADPVASGFPLGWRAENSPPPGAGAARTA
jgi:thiol-disulfide isomerase/thioredoxin